MKRYVFTLSPRRRNDRFYCSPGICCAMAWGAAGAPVRRLRSRDLPLPDAVPGDESCRGDGVCGSIRHRRIMQKRAGKLHGLRDAVAAALLMYSVKLVAGRTSYVYVNPP